MIRRFLDIINEAVETADPRTADPRTADPQNNDKTGLGARAKVKPEVRDANFDYGHRNDPDHPVSFNFGEFGNKGEGKGRTKHSSRYADNPMVDPDLEELEEAEIGSLDRLAAMFAKAGISDREIKAGINLTPRGCQKVAARLGVAASDVPTLIASLITKLGRQDRHLATAYESAMQEGGLYEDDPTPPGTPPAPPVAGNPAARYSYEDDYNGNVTVRDGTTGKQVYLQGSQATQLLSKLKSGGDIQDVLAGYQSMMESDTLDGGGMEGDDTFKDEINGSGGSYNFTAKIDGKSFMGTAGFSDASGKPKISLLRVADAQGKTVTLDGTLHAKLLQAARDFIGRE